MDIQEIIDLWGAFEHNPDTCPYCGDESAGRGLLRPVTPYERHLAAKLAELEKYAQGQAREIHNLMFRDGDNGVY